MNKIVREHYPVADLPENLREGFEPNAQVRITVELDATMPPETRMTLEEMFAFLPRRVMTTDEAVAKVRRLRDEWDD